MSGTYLAHHELESVLIIIIIIIRPALLVVNLRQRMQTLRVKVTRVGGLVLCQASLRLSNKKNETLLCMLLYLYNRCYSPEGRDLTATANSYAH